MQILELDQALFNANHNGVVIADTLPNAGKLFSKVEFASSQLPEALRARCRSRAAGQDEPGVRARLDDLRRHQRRGGTVQLLHVSELGKIARKYPQRSEEIITGAFESVPADGCIVVESTAEGAAGEFYDLVMPALKRKQEGAPESALDWRLHFFPWYQKEGLPARSGRRDRQRRRPSTSTACRPSSASPSTPRSARGTSRSARRSSAT
jgi:hypothetical protein